MAFDAYDRSLDLIRAVPLAKLASCDPDLSRQLRRALQSVTQNIAEANRRAGKDRKHLFRVALGSAAEAASCLELALAFGYLAPADVAAPLELADRVRAMTFRKSRRMRRGSPMSFAPPCLEPRSRCTSLATK